MNQYRDDQKVNRQRTLDRAVQRGFTLIEIMVVVIIIGLLVENVIFRSVEVRTIRRWGMAS